MRKEQQCCRRPGAPGGKSRGSLFFLLTPLLLAGCSLFPAAVEPSIKFTKLPAYGAGSFERLDTIEGVATGVHPGERVVLYARSGVWWIQPFAAKPFTEVQADSVWKNRTHPGSAYAALLVKEGFHPGLRIDALPEKGDGVLAVATAEATVLPRPPGKTLEFGGYEWQIRQTPNDPGGTRNYYNPENAWTDASGLLHLRIAGHPGHWTSAEVNLRRSLGYGSYRFVVRDLSHLEPAAVFTMLTWDDGGPSREMDIEVSQWGETTTRNGQFVIQPYHVPANTVQFQAPPGTVTFVLRWSPGRAAFKAFRGAVSRWDSPAVREHVFTSGVPAPGNESVHLNFYVFGNTSHPLRQGSEVIVEKFEYLP